MTVDSEIRAAVAEIVDPLVREIHELKAMLNPPKEWLTVKEAEAHYGVSASTLYRWIDEGSVESRGCGKARRIRV